MRSLTVLLCLTLVSAAFGAATFAGDECADALGCVEIAPGETIKFGGLQLTESSATTAESTASAFELAARARGGLLLGHEIELVLADSACDEDEAREAARRMTANPSIVGLIGTNCSLAAKGALPIVSEAGWLMISPSNTSPLLTNSDAEAGGLYQPGYFRTAHNDLFQGALSAQFAATALKVKTVATIDDGDPYTRGLANAMAETFETLDGEVVFRGEISKGATDIDGIFSALVESEAELFYFPVFTAEALIIARQLAEAPGLADTIMMTADGAYSTTFAHDVGAAGIGMYVASAHVTGEDYETFVETWRREIDEAGPAGSFHAHGYDAANLLLDAAEAVATERDDGTLVIGRGALREALAAVAGYPGLTGALTCQDESPHAGDCATGEALAVFQLTAAEIHEGNWPPPVVWTAAMAEGG